MAPGDNMGELDDAAFDDGVDDAVGSGVIVLVVLGCEEAGGLVVGTISDGKSCPGLNINVAFLANSNWVSKFLMIVGLMTPIIPSSMQAPGAEQ
jgi:hypothetical protein